MKKSKKTGNVIWIVSIVAAVPILLILGLVLAEVSSSNAGDTAQGESYLQALENIDIQSVEQNIRDEVKPQKPDSDNSQPFETPTSKPAETVPVETFPQETVSDINESEFAYSNNACYVPYGVDIEKHEQVVKQYSEGNITLKEIFDNSLFVGDSIMTGFHDFQLVSPGNVIANVGCMLNPHLADNMQYIINYNPEYLILHYGLNEMDVNNERLDAFINRYTNNIKTLKEELPDTKIIVVGLMPVRNDAIEKQPRLARVAAYNERIREMCIELGVGYNEDSELFLSHKDLYVSDGIHVQKKMYLYWMEKFISEMGIY